MKKPIAVITLLAGTVSVYSQGLVNMIDYGNAYVYHVYAPQTSAPTGTVTSYTTTYGGYTSGLEYEGDVSNDKPSSPANNAVYSAGTALSGTGYDAQLLGAANTGDALSSLSPLGTIYNFYTVPSFAGSVNATPGHLIAIPGSAPGLPSDGGNGATVALAVWANSGSQGAANTLSQAQLYGYAWGVSDIVSLTATGGDGSPLTPPYIGIESFSLGEEEEVVPEPGSIAFVLIGASPFLFRRTGKCRLTS